MVEKIYPSKGLGGSLRFAFWNIGGFNSKTIGKKFLSSDFLDEVGGYDVIGLAETHIHSNIIEDLYIPGYKLISCVNRKYNPKSKTAPGGIAIFSNNSISKYFVSVNRDNQDVIWVKIKRNSASGLKNQDIYLGTVYHSPSGNKENVLNKYKSLTEDISFFQSKGYVILQGDFNARTNNLPDFIINDNFIEVTGEQDHTNISLRNSEDTKKVDIRGGELLDLCKTLKMSILNGRKSGDLFGKITSFQWNGQGVIDYILSSHNLYSHIPYFRVGNYSPWVSDHCPILFKLNLSINVLPKQVGEDLRSSPERFYFNNESINKLTETLKSREFTDKLNSLENISDHEPHLLASEITTMLIVAAKQSKIKSTKNQPKSSKWERWYDKDCQVLKQSLKRKCRKLKTMQGNSNVLRMDILKENKEFKKLVKKKKNSYKLQIVENMKLKRNEPRIFWKLLDKLDHKSKNQPSPISGEKWKKHFISILQTKMENPNYPPDSVEEGPLDYNISTKELLKGSYILRPNKSPGFDTISNEMIKILVDTNPEIVVKLFNNILKTNAKIDEWTTSIITPIHKSGSKSCPTNYRGISVLPCLSKFYSSILNTRLKNYVVENNILCEEQLGFKEGNRTSDAHIILHTLIQNYCHKNKNKIYACFVDFKKAFDSIPRELLFEKLLNHGVRGKFFNALKTMYDNDRCCVRVDDKITGTFLANQGVKQGCVLSPLLFNIFLSDLPNQLLSPECHPVQLENYQNLGGLFWADDVVLLSQSETGLQNMLTKLDTYSLNNFLEINLEKTKGMTFNKSGRFYKRAYKLGSGFIYTTNSYKYLGLIFTPSVEINSDIISL